MGAESKEHVKQRLPAELLVVGQRSSGKESKASEPFALESSFSSYQECSEIVPYSPPKIMTVGKS